jgi:hypothetical protein
MSAAQSVVSFARQLKEEVRAHLVRVNASARAVIADNLVFVYHMIVASEGILCTAHMHMTDGAYRRWIAAHYQEEFGHAKWLRADLQASGVCVHNAPLMHDAAALAGAQYYLAAHVSPYAILGYMLALECFPMSIADVAELEKLHGVSLFTTLRYHAVHDLEHGDDVLEQIDNMPPVYRELVRDNALRTVKAIARSSRAFGTFPALPAHA